MSQDFSSLPYRPCVGIALFNTDGKVFVGERIDTPGAWQMPQGGIDDGEGIKAAFYRELVEEVGTDKADIIRIMERPLRYDLPPHLLGKLWNGQYAGQEQIWIAARYTGRDDDIIIHTGHNGADPEFRAWKWVSLDDILNLIVPFKRDTYRAVIEEFSDLAK